MIDVLRRAGGPRGVSPSRGRAERKRAPRTAAAPRQFHNLFGFGFGGRALPSLFQSQQWFARSAKLFIQVVTPETRADMTSLCVLF